MKKSRFIPIIILLVFNAGCGRSERAYQTAVAQNTPAAYESFLKQNPDSAYDSDVKGRLELLRFNSAKQINTVAALSDFITLFPLSKQIGNAKDAIAAIVYAEATAAKSRVALESFVRDYPASALVEEAKQKILKMDYDSTVTAGVSRAFKDFLANHPKSPYSPEIESLLAESLAKEEWREINKTPSVEKYASYLARNPKTNLVKILRSAVRCSPYMIVTNSYPAISFTIVYEDAERKFSVGAPMAREYNLLTFTEAGTGAILTRGPQSIDEAEIVLVKEAEGQSSRPRIDEYSIYSIRKWSDGARQTNAP